MLFHRLEFISLFILTLVGHYSISNRQIRMFFLLIISYVFYMWESRLNGIYIFTSTLVAYFTALKIHKTKKARYLILNLVINFSLLFFFKSAIYIFPFLKSMFPDIKFEYFSLPLGLSFYTFQAVSYAIDVSRKDAYPESNFISFSLYHSFFPQLIAGPIERVNDLLPQLKQKPIFNYLNFKKGLLIFIFGLIKKRIIADRLAMIGEVILNHQQAHSSLALLLGGYCISFQYYCDFSAYSEMALGTALMMGINLKRNFNFPFLASSPIDFWRRWHITLMNWLHDYIYRPILSLDFSFPNLIFATMIVFLFAGIWHGINLNFFIWGLINGFAVILNVIIKKKFRFNASRLIVPFQVFLTFHLFVLNGVFLFFETPSQAFEVLLKILSFKGFHITSILKEISIYDLYIGLVGVILLILTEVIFSKQSFWTFYSNLKGYQRWMLYILAIILLIIYPYSISRSYVYFKF